MTIFADHDSSLIRFRILVHTRLEYKSVSVFVVHLDPHLNLSLISKACECRVLFNITRECRVCVCFENN